MILRIFSEEAAQPHDAPVAGLVVSGDGYIRVVHAEPGAIDLVHLLSGADQAPGRHAGASAPVLTGFTEWISAGTPAVTLGWDWKMDASRQPGVLQRVAWPRNNLMLCGSMRQDVGPDETARLLARMIDLLAWQEIVRAHLHIDPPPPHGACAADFT